jgi:hypothetical protein
MHKLLVNGIDILPKSNNLSWSSDTDTLGQQLSFDSLYDVSEGDVISFVFNSKEYIRGIVVNKEEKKFSYSYVCFDFSFYLKNEVIKQFNTNISNAITSLLNEYKIPCSVVNIPTKIKKIYKDESIASIIDDMLSQAEADQRIKYFKEMNVDTLKISKLSDMKITPKILIPKDIVISSSIEDMRNKIIIVSNEESNSLIQAVAEDKTGQNTYGLLQDIESVDKKDIAQAKNIANNLLKARNKIFKDTSFNVLGLRDAELIRANRLIEINVGTKLKGWYKIKSASHSLANNKHFVSIGLEW